MRVVQWCASVNVAQVFITSASENQNDAGKGPSLRLHLCNDESSLESCVCMFLEYICTTSDDSYCAFLREGNGFSSQVRGHLQVDHGENQLLVDAPIGNEVTTTRHDNEGAVDHSSFTASDIPNRMCTVASPRCTNPKSAKTTVVLLEHGYYGDQPVSKLLLIPHTGITDKAPLFIAFNQMLLSFIHDVLSCYT